MSKVLTEYRLLAVLVGVSAMVALAAIPASDLPRGLFVLGSLVGALYYWVASRRERRRQRYITEPFPETWRDVLQRRVPLYSLLSPGEQQRFESEIQIFLGEQRIYALGDTDLAVDRENDQRTPISDENRLLVAASAATLLLGRPEWRLPTVRDIVIYPSSFTEESYRAQSSDPRDPPANTIGMVHAQGPILFSLDALEHSYPVQSGASVGVGISAGSGVGLRSTLGMSEPVLPHVGIHEFAHVLDFLGSGSGGAQGDQYSATGVPGMLSRHGATRWHQQMIVERERLIAGQSILSSYGLKSDAELFAVSVESFFQDALRMRVYHPDLYALLAEFFNQDPAGRLVAHHATFVFRPWFALGPTQRYTA